ncbi:hypothetical protein ALC57_15407 [Trachymyrmex cornetzi]|uniref:Uncharacterized protein n=1 Tax=Trachymyrmex cornetzi TaxID=471704 RepID=A0A151IX92_9HYME|nr:hypothetical protein ALC57_15407 [Trachymyrmex cornetzi]
MLLIVSDTCDVHSLTAKELEYIPKIILLRKFKNYIDQLWDRLPEHIKADSEIQQHRLCLKHYNLSTHRSHIDGPAPFIKNCSESVSNWVPSIGSCQLVGDAAEVAKAITDNKAAQNQLEELKRHNHVMEGHGVYLAPYKHG